MLLTETSLTEAFPLYPEIANTPMTRSLARGDVIMSYKIMEKLDAGETQGYSIARIVKFVCKLQPNYCGHRDKNSQQEASAPERLCQRTLSCAGDARS
jgi:hypothetical protein